MCLGSSGLAAVGVRPIGDIGCWMSTEVQDDESLTKEMEEGIENDEGEEVDGSEEKGDTGKKQAKKKPSKKAIGASKSKATAVKDAGIAKKPKEPKAPKPRRPFSRISDEDLLRRQGMIKERLDVAQAQITIMTSKWQKYEDERLIREDIKTGIIA